MRIVVLTGAGISAESGVPTFRGPDGLWEGHRVEDVATPEAFRRNPELVQRFYNLRRAKLVDGSVGPNPAHRALARLEERLGEDLLVVTQNIDDLHERGGLVRVLHMHGELLKCRCMRCAAVSPWRRDLGTDSVCPECAAAGTLRPHVVWFGEMPLELDFIGDAIARADRFVSIGTSGNVYPAAGFVRMAAEAGVETLEMNLEPSAGSGLFGESRLGPAGVLVPQWVDGILAESGDED